MEHNEELFFEEEEAYSPAMTEEASQPFVPVDYTVTGEVMRIVYSKPEDGYAVLKLRDHEKHELTLVGVMPNVMEGQEIEAVGRWEMHREHGRQFRVSSFRPMLPSSVEGIKRFLASGVLPGIGAKYANRIIEHFGTETLHILDGYSERLKEVPGLGKKRIAEIRNAWKKTTADRETRIFLQGVGLTGNLCTKIIAKYGNGAAADMVRKNPYRLANEIDGIGFLTADAIAAKVGIEPENPMRLCAGVVYALEEIASSGHTCCPKEMLMLAAEKLLHVSQTALEQGVAIAIAENKIMREEVIEADESVELLFTRRLRIAEMELAHSIRVLLANAPAPLTGFSAVLGEGFERLNAAQRQAVNGAFQHGFSIVTGGPGVGKTTVVNQMCAIAKALRLRVLLAAPTGRAAKRLSEATGRDAQTIHRLLKWDVQEKAFYHNEDAPLECDLLIIDEVSMLDTLLAANLFCAVLPGTRVVLVGDKDQLPSVGPGAVLYDLISCGRIPVTYLTEVYRQAEGSRIITNAHAVNHGHLPDLRPWSPPPQNPNARCDFYWVEQEDPAKTADIIVRTVTRRIQPVFGFDPVLDVQVLAPMRKGDCGTIVLNELLQNALNPSSPDKTFFQFGARLFRVGDKVMQTSNNYDKGVFNGEMGIISSIDNDTATFQVLFDIGKVDYQQMDADQLQLAYAVTVHKSQGSEYPVVLMPVLNQHFVMLQKNLIYTGMTRARKLLIMVGTTRALAIAVANDKPNRRRTRLAQRISDQEVSSKRTPCSP